MINGNKIEAKPKVVHIVGNSYAELAKLDQVMLFEKFLILALTSPKEAARTNWALGQGLSSTQFRCIQAVQKNIPNLTLINNCHLPDGQVLNDIAWVTNVTPLSQYHYQGRLALPKNHAAHKSLTVAMSDLVHAGQQLLQGMIDHMTQQPCYLLIRNISGRLIHRVFPIQVNMDCAIEKFQKTDQGLQIKAKLSYYQSGQLVTKVEVSAILHNIRQHIKEDKALAEKAIVENDKWWLEN